MGGIALAVLACFARPSRYIWPVNQTPITELNDRNRHVTGILISTMLLFLCACSETSNQNETSRSEKISSVRIESISVWTFEHEAYALNADGSGFYERVSTFDAAADQTGVAKPKILKRLEFGKGKVDFDIVLSHIGGLKKYFGDDGHRNAFVDHVEDLKLKRAIPCGQKATDNGSYVIYWNATSQDEIIEKKDISKIFVIDRGCKSPEATAILNQIRSAVKTFDGVAPASES